MHTRSNGGALGGIVVGTQIGTHEMQSSNRSRLRASDNLVVGKCKRLPVGLDDLCQRSAREAFGSPAVGPCKRMPLGLVHQSCCSKEGAPRSIAVGSCERLSMERYDLFSSSVHRNLEILQWARANKTHGIMVLKVLKV
jgi:hypothetical protein